MRRRSLPYSVAAPLLALAALPRPARAQVCTTEAEVTGFVADLLSGSPLPGATVILRSPAEFVYQIEAQGTSGDAGAFRLCVDEVGEGWDLIAQLDTLESRGVPVTGPGPADTLFVPWSRPVTLGGSVRDQASGEPVEGARVRVANRRVRATTDGRGAFSLRGLGAGPLVVEVSAMGRATRTDTVFAASGANVRLDITIGEEAIALDPIVVTARQAPDLRVRGVQDLGMTAEQVAEALPRSIDFIALLRQANIAGLQIRPATNGYCIEFMRTSGDCRMVQVFVNGIRVPEPHAYVTTIDPSTVKEFFVLRPAFAQFQYMGPLTPNGVLDIILR